VWNARTEDVPRLVDGVPSDWGPVLDDVGAAYLPFLTANAEAWRDGRRRFDVTIQGTTYLRVPTSRYRVWCLEQLRRHHDALPPSARSTVGVLLDRHGCTEPLWRATDCRSGHDPDDQAPFGRGLRVF
jgi:hypothetical protein